MKRVTVSRISFILFGLTFISYGLQGLYGIEYPQAVIERNEDYIPYRKAVKRK